jgi:succinyl-CoA synthetase alpha subunit
VKIVNAMKASAKPVVALFLGYVARARDENVWFARTLDEAGTAGLPVGARGTRQEMLPATTGGVSAVYTPAARWRRNPRGCWRSPGCRPDAITIRA